MTSPALDRLVLFQAFVDLFALFSTLPKTQFQISVNIFHAPPLEPFDLEWSIKTAILTIYYIALIKLSNLDPKCRDHCHCPAPFTYSVWQKGYFHPFPLTVGI